MNHRSSLLTRLEHAIVMVDRHHTNLWSVYSRRRKKWLTKRERARRQWKRAGLPRHGKGVL